jgi:hypothetical protein
LTSLIARWRFFSMKFPFKGFTIAPVFHAKNLKPVLGAFRF